MAYYLVTKLAEEKTSTGVIQRVDSLVFGVFTTLTRANEIADKHDANVTTLDRDTEARKVVEHWENPGYYEDE